MSVVFKAPSLKAWIAASGAAVVASAALYVAFFVSIGDPLGMLGSARGAWETIRPYYKPGLAIGAFCLAFLLPEASPLTGLLFGGTQAIACMICSGVTAARGHEWWTNAMWPLALVMLPLDVAVWVVPGVLAGVGLRLGARLISARRGGAPGS